MMHGRCPIDWAITQKLNLTLGYSVVILRLLPGDCVPLLELVETGFEHGGDGGGGGGG